MKPAVKPVFQIGSTWTTIEDSNYEVKIIAVDKFGLGAYDYLVAWENKDGMRICNGAWQFQARYKLKEGILESKAPENLKDPQSLLLATYKARESAGEFHSFQTNLL